MPISIDSMPTFSFKFGTRDSLFYNTITLQDNCVFGNGPYFHVVD